MRIVVNGWFMDQLSTGSGQYLDGLAAWLPRAGADHEFVLVRPAVSGPPAENAEHKSPTSVHASRITHHVSRFTFHASPSGWQVVSVGTPFDRLSRDLAKLWFEQVAFPQACRRWRADVALVPYWGSPWWSACPTVVTIHDLIPLLLPLYRGGPLQRAYTALVARTARRAYAVLTDSAASRRDVIEHLRIPPDRVHAVHLAVEERFRPVDDPAVLARVRAKYGLPEESFLLYLGGFDARKNVVRMLEAYARAIKEARRGAGATGDQSPGIRLVVAGRLPQRDSAFAPDPRAVVERLGIGDWVHFAGWVEETDKPELYSMARGALYLSEYEGFGLPVLEAMASGCPVVAGGGPGGDGDQCG
jgi:glycosyltransferase involved in cell wall biosynthesis